MPTVIDLVSSDEDTPLPRAGRRGHFGRNVPLTSPTASSSVEPAPATHAMASPGTALNDDTLGGAEVFDPDDIDFNEFFEMPGAFLEDRPPAAAATRDPTPLSQGQFVVIDGENVFIPDSPRPVRAGPIQTHQEALDLDAAYEQETANFTADVCLKRVLAMFPDIDHEYVVTLYNGYDLQGTEALSGGARLEAIVEKLLSGEIYPRQARQALQRKRKRDEGGTDLQSKRWEGPDREIAPPALKGAMASILKVEFPEMTKTAIAKELLASRHLYPAYLALAKAKDSSDVNKKWSGKPPKDLTFADTLATHCGWPSMREELEAARKHVKDLRRQRVIADAKKWAEKENLQRAIDAGETAECQACFDDLPMNRQIHCNGDTAHFTCFDCAIAYVKSEVGDSRCRVLCTAGCGAAFARAQLHLLDEKELLEKLERLQQEKEIRDAGLDNLEECPFCDYKAILPPVEEDFEFRCANEECEKISCRRCKAVSHIPISCEEYAKDHKLSSRHKVEEAMTKALIRNCGKCKQAFIKEYGCNKMSCPSCGNMQCYVCSASLKDYNHFDQAPRGLPGSKLSKCPLYDNVEERHEREIKEAEAAAREEVINDDPDVSAQDLEIKVSDAVKKATDERIKRAGAVPGGVPPGYGGLAAAGLPAGLYMQQVLGHRLQNRANNREAVRELGGDGDNAGRRELLLARRRHLQLQQHRLRRDQLAAGPANVFGRGLRALAGAMRPDQVQAIPQPPRAPPVLQRPAGGGVIGGLNEDPLGVGNDGDPMGHFRPMCAPPPPHAPFPAFPLREPLARDAGHNDAVQATRARIQELQDRLRIMRDQKDRPLPVQPLRRSDEAEQMRLIEAATRQHFNDHRVGHGIVFSREPDDHQRLRGPMGWPGQD